MTTLGILITYYNEKELLGECLRSILEEKNPPHEVLIYDDASTFPALDFVPKMFAHRVKVIRGEKNVGPAVGRNRLLRESQSDYIKFHDCDDVFYPGWSERVLPSLNKEAPDVILFEVDSYTDGNLVQRKVIGLKDIQGKMDPVRFAIHRAIVTSSAFYRKEFVLKAGAYREDLWQSEDHEFHIRVLNQKPKLKILHESLLELHVRKESRSQKLLEVWQCRLQGLKIAFSYLATQYRGDLCDASAEVGSKLFQLGDRKSARAAFDWAKTLGSPHFPKRPWLHRLLAKYDPFFAEKVASVYRARRRLFRAS